jgi:hypothetical protein
MSTAVMKARVAGFFWLMTAVTGMYAMAGDRLILWRDAAATAANIVAHESQFRMSVVANIIAAACYVVATVLVYDLLKPVNRNVSLLAAFFSLVASGIAGISFVFRLGPLSVLTGAESLSGFGPEQLQALALTLLRVGAQGFYLSHVFYGLHCLLVGGLILRSTFLPRIVGALMVFAGLGWLTMSFASLVSPPFARALSPWLMLPGAIGEICLLLWLLVMGVNVDRWREQAGARLAEV